MSKTILSAISILLLLYFCGFVYIVSEAETTTTDSLREHHLQRKRLKLQKLRSTKNSSVQMNKKDIKIKGRDEVVIIHCERNSSTENSLIPPTYSESFRILKDVATRNYNTLIPCLRNSVFLDMKMDGFDRDKCDPTTLLAFPDDAEAHYQELLLKTKPLREIPIHTYNGYNGPWIENLFISRFVDKPLSYFGGLIPIFVQFVDIHILDRFNKTNAKVPKYNQMVESLVSILRKDCIYLAVSQDDQGLTQRLHQYRPNILVISAGGYGHIPMPLIKDEIPRAPISQYSFDISFVGNTRPLLTRSAMLVQLQEVINEHNKRAVFYSNKAATRFFCGKHTKWKQVMEASKFNLAPRGYGRSSYRLAEIVQMGRIPVYMFDDVKWLPYQNTNISFSTFGFIGRMDYMRRLYMQLIHANSSQFDDKMEQVRRVRPYYTYEGVLQQIDLFFRDPLGPHGGYLRCERVPERDH